MQNISITQKVPLCHFAGDSFLTPRPWQPAWDSQDCMGLSRLQNDDPFTEQKASQICPLLYMYENSVPLDCCVLLQPHSCRKPICLHKFKGIFSAGRFNTGTAGLCVLTPVFHVLEGTLLLTFKGITWTPNGWPLRAYKQKAYKRQSSDSYQRPHTEITWGVKIKNIPDAWSIPRAPSVISLSVVWASGVLKTFQMILPYSQGNEPEIKVWWLLQEKSFKFRKLCIRVLKNKFP